MNTQTRTLKITIKQLEYFLDKTISDDTFYVKILENRNIHEIFSMLNTESLIGFLDIPIRVIVKHNSQYMSVSFDKLPTLLSPIANDIEEIVDINQYLCLKFLKFYNAIDYSSIVHLQLISNNTYINTKSNSQYSDLNYLLTAILLSDKFGSIYKNFINDTFRNNKSFLLNNKSQNSIYSLIFNQKRKEKITERSKYNNPRANHINKINKSYLSVGELTKSSHKPIIQLFCPICNKTFKSKDDLILVKDHTIVFDCDHSNTIFSDYSYFEYKADDDISQLDNIKIIKWFNHNIKVYNHNGIYKIHIYTKNNYTEYPITKYIINNNSTFNKLIGKIDLEEEFQIDVQCPICNYNYHVNFGTYDCEKNGIVYKNYKDIFTFENSKFYFNCSHNKGYKNYKNFYIYKIKIKDLDENSVIYFKKHALAICLNYKKVWIDGKEMIKRYINNKDFEIIDLSSYYVF